MRRALALLLLAASFDARAHTTSALRGRVTDAKGEPLPGVTVEVAAPPARARFTVTGTDGSYTVGDLAPATYRVTFRLGDAAKETREVAVTLEKTARLDAVLALAKSSSVEVTARRTLKDLTAAGEYGDTLVGVADAATEGTVTKQRLEERTISRPAEVLETVPGVVISQHSGEGKANQYYLRGFNLDHGTDLASWVAGVPVNLPSHAHGQGYSDLNFLIPELITSVQFRKGPYSAEEGDFSAAGAVRIGYTRRLPNALVDLTGGSFGYQRALAASSFPLGGGDLLAAGELFRNDGPWVHPDGYRKLNGILGYSHGDARNGWRVTAMGYQGKWDSTDQIARRAVDESLVSRFGTLDPTDGGRTYRYGLSGEWQRGSESSVTSASAYAFTYGLNLWNDFTYFLDDPVHGDQFEQEDRRVVTGGRVTQRWLGTLLGLPFEGSAGLEGRNDNVTSLGLYHDEARVRLETRLHDHVTQTSGALFGQAAISLASGVRAVVGLRADAYRFRVGSEEPRNSGDETKGLLSPKLALVFGPFTGTELYVDAGTGFHSNDARGVTLRVTPSGQPAPPVSPLVRAKGAEFGFRTAALPHLEVTGAVWILDLDSELVFSGDAGDTEPSRASRRRGVELGAAWRPAPAIRVETDVSVSRARFRTSAPQGDEIPGSLQDVVTAGAFYDPPEGLLAGLKVRYLGPRPLLEDGSVRSRSSTTLDARLGWRFASRWCATLDVVNLLDAKVSDVDYFYTSRLPGEAAEGVAGIHTHPAEPLSARLSIGAGF